jgi:arginase
MAAQPLSSLQVIAVRYRDSKLAVNDERSIDRYAESGVYKAAQMPFEVSEPAFPEDLRTGVEPDDIGLIGGAIAEAVGAARWEGKAILMTGGNCSHTTGLMGGLQDAHGPAVRIGLVWFDAHGDFNTPKTTLSGMYGGMPVAVSAGLAYPRWREASHMAAPLPTDRIILVDVRNLDPSEEQLIRATEAVIASPAPGFPGEDLGTAVRDLAERCDMLYLHIDSDILDEAYVPSHHTVEPDGPNMEQVQSAIDTVMSTGKVVAYAVVSVHNEGENSDVSVASGIELIRGGLQSWRRHGTTKVKLV